MSLPVVLRDEAQAEFDEAFDYFEGQKPGLGVAFAARVQEVFDRIGTNPHLHAAVFADIHKAGVARFPYGVFYRIINADVVVIACFHGSRDPRRWRARE